MKSKHVLKFWIAPLILIVVIACSEEEIQKTEVIEPVPPVTEKPVKANHIDYVYAAFNESINGKWVASLWGPDGERTPVRMSDGTRNAHIAALAIGENFSLYAAGSEQNSKNQYYAKYWANCSAVILGDSSSTLYSSAEDIFVSGEDVYVAGDQFNGQHTVAVYWKNGVQLNLTDGETDAYARKIVVSGSDVYVIGSEKNQLGNLEARFWKNGTRVEFVGSIASSLYVKGDDVYISGNFGSATKYWKNGSLISLNEGLQQATSTIFVAGENVYTTSPGKYWKGNLSFDLITETANPNITSLYVVGDDVFVGGFESVGDTYKARFWKNGEATDVTDGTNNAGVSAVAVMRLPIN